MMNFLTPIFKSSVAVCLLLTSYLPALCQERYLFVGTFTNRTSEGIYVYKFNETMGALTQVSIAKGIANPGFLAVAKNGRYLYAGSKFEAGVVQSFGFDAKTGQLSPLNSQPSGGENPCHVALDQSGKWLFTGNYHGGSVGVLPILADGTLGAPVQVIKHEGRSINAERQEAAHVHSINVAPNNRDIFVPDLGQDKVVSYTFDATAGRLTAAPTPFVGVTAGSGPRHFVFHPKHQWAYVVQELDNSVTVFDYLKGNLSQKQIVSTLPADFKDKSYAADIHISPDGRFLYASNRGHDSIVVFAIDPKTGQLSLVEHQGVHGKWPRNFSIDTTGKFLLVANQESDNIVVFRRNQRTGKLSYANQEAQVSMPVCLRFL